MNKNSRKTRIEIILRSNFTPNFLIVRDDSNKHEGHFGVVDGAKETHFYIKMILEKSESMTKIDLHRKVYALLEEEFVKGLHALELDLTNT